MCFRGSTATPSAYVPKFRAIALHVHIVGDCAGERLFVFQIGDADAERALDGFIARVACA